MLASHSLSLASEYIFRIHLSYLFGSWNKHLSEPNTEPRNRTLWNRFLFHFLLFNVQCPMLFAWRKSNDKSQTIVFIFIRGFFFSLPFLSVSNFNRSYGIAFFVSMFHSLRLENWCLYYRFSQKHSFPTFRTIFVLHWIRFWKINFGHFSVEINNQNQNNKLIRNRMKSLFRILRTQKKKKKENNNIFYVVIRTNLIHSLNRILNDGCRENRILLFYYFVQLMARITNGTIISNFNNSTMLPVATVVYFVTNVLIIYRNWNSNEPNAKPFHVTCN